MKTDNILNPHVMPGPGIAPGPQWWEASALTTVPSMHPHPVLWARLEMIFISTMNQS